MHWLLKKPILFYGYASKELDNSDFHKLPVWIHYMNISTSKYDLGNNMESFDIIMRSKCKDNMEGTSIHKRSN